MRTQPVFVLVNSGQQVADFPVAHGLEGALYVPAVDSCTAALRGSWDQTSANYVPVKYNAVPASGQALSSLQDITIPVGPGNVYVALDYNVAAILPNLRVVLSVAQAAPRTLCMMAKWD